MTLTMNFASPGRIAYVAAGGLYVMNADGSNQTLVMADSSWPVSWSPDGRRLVTSATSADQRGQVHVFIRFMNADGTNIVDMPIPDEVDPRVRTNLMAV